MDSPEAAPRGRELATAGLPQEDLQRLEDALWREDWRLVPAGEPSAALFAPGGPDAVLVDGALAESEPRWLDLAGRPGVTVPALAVVSRGQAGLLARLLRGGASDCLVRPLQADKVLAALRQTLGLQALQGHVDRRLQALAAEDAFLGVVAESPAMRRTLMMAARAAAHPVDVLILGETGTGKELLARAVHGASSRKRRPFVAVDCGALPPDLVEGLLFGQRKGAFTGATDDKAGLLEQADGGTVFLDEVGNLPLEAQTKLLRVLQTRENWRLGDTAPRPLDLRVVAATNSDLEKHALAGQFRLDLFHRLCDFPLRVPPLRERPGDVDLLARMFFNRHRARFSLPELRLPRPFVERLEAYPWPGNVRQLENAMKQAAVLAEDQVGEDQLPREVLAWVRPPEQSVQVAAPRFNLPEGVMPLWQAERLVTAEVETRLLSEAVAQCKGDRVAAAARLNLHPKTLARKLKDLRIG